VQPPSYQAKPALSPTGTNRTTSNVRQESAGQSGKHLLVASISPFDPYPKSLVFGRGWLSCRKISRSQKHMLRKTATRRPLRKDPSVLRLRRRAKLRSPAGQEHDRIMSPPERSGSSVDRRPVSSAARSGWRTDLPATPECRLRGLRPPVRRQVRLRFCPCRAERTRRCRDLADRDRSGSRQAPSGSGLPRKS
jgi:hypothetical protein